MNSNLFYFDQLTKYSPYFNLALEEAIAINLFEFGYGGAIRFWTNHNTIVLGISDSVSKNIPIEKISTFNNDFPHLQNSRKFQNNSMYISRRASGGGTVFHDEAFNLNYSLFASTKEKKELYPVKESYNLLLGLITNALAKQNISANSAGKSDIAIKNEGGFKKISGNAQFRKRDCIVQHGTLILDLKIIDSVLENLSHPPEEPEYRKNRKHSDFLTSLPKEFSVPKFKLELTKIFQEFLGLKQEQRQDRKFLRQVFRDAKRLMSEKYANIEFIFSKP
ncbi:MAG: lipoate--protein ligase family protein [Leptospiraceae bacterium]|nr:lipoate--protein ligase family protein [Leptospiraceae bacterium]